MGSHDIVIPFLHVIDLKEALLIIRAVEMLMSENASGHPGLRNDSLECFLLILKIIVGVRIRRNVADNKQGSIGASVVDLLVEPGVIHGIVFTLIIVEEDELPLIDDG